MKKRNITARIKETSGETIAETLVTMIILSLSVLMITGAVVTAAKGNEKADNTETAFVVSDESTVKTSVQPVTIGEQAGGIQVNGTVTVYETENSYFYYDSAAGSTGETP